MTEIKINRLQADQLIQIMSHFRDIEEFTIVSDSSSGIGPTVRVLFNLLGSKNNDTSVDITDVSSW